jgi:hypothetical protein
MYSYTGTGLAITTITSSTVVDEADEVAEE